MERFGRPRFRGAPAPKPFGTRPAPSTRSGLLGAGPSHSSNQFGSFRDNQSQEWQTPRSSSGGSLLGTVPKRSSQNQNSNSYGGSNMTASSGQQWKPDNLSVPSEVRQLMQTLGLSQADMQKLSQLPENELSVNNLAQAIGDLRHGKQDYGGRPQSNSSGPSMSDRPGSYRRGQRGSYPGDGDSYNQRDGILGQHPGERSNYHSPRDEHFDNDRSPGSNRSYSSAGTRHKPTGIKVTVKPTDHPNRSEYLNSKGNSGFSGPRGPVRGDHNDDYFEENRFYGRGGSADRYDQRNDSYSQNSRRISNKNLSMREGPSRQQGYGNERRDRERLSPGHGPRGRGGMPRPMGTRHLPKPSSIRPLMEQSPRSGRGSGGLLGNPLRPNAQGLENLVAAVGGSTVSQAASLLNPLVLATQADPSVLEAQIQAMKAIQAQAIKLKQQSPYYESSGRDKDRPRRRSPASRGMGIDRRLEEEARKEAQEMRSSRGRVLYIRYKSPRIMEIDLRQLATAFGKVTKLLIIKPRVRNGHFQAFMEMEQWDCAAAMLEHYMAKSPNIKGCPVEVQRSNYSDLQLRSEQIQQRGSKRSRSVSPVRKGSTQLPYKRERRNDDKPKLSITTSKSNRRVVARSSDDSRSSDRKSLSSEKDKSRDLDNLDKTDAREILNRSRSNQDKKDSERRDSSRGRRASARSYRRSPSGSNKGNADENDKTDDAEEGQEEILEGEEIKKDEAAKDIEDPLDAIADELALHDEFVLMDEVGYDGEQKRAAKKVADDNIKDDDKKTQLDLERTDLDLEDVKVEINQNEPEVTDEKKLEEDDDDQDETDVKVDIQDVNNEEEDVNNKEEAEEQTLAVEDEDKMITNEEDVEKTDDVDVKDDLQDSHEVLKEEEQSYAEDAACLDNSTDQYEGGDDMMATDLSTECLNDDRFDVDGNKEDVDPVDEELLEDKDDLSPPATQNSESLQDENDQETEFDKAPENELQFAVKDSLKEVYSAKEHLEALTKVTKAKAAQAIAKKLNACLMVAISRLEGVDYS